MEGGRGKGGKTRESRRKEKRANVMKECMSYWNTEAHGKKICQM